MTTPDPNELLRHLWDYLHRNEVKYKREGEKPASDLRKGFCEGMEQAHREAKEWLRTKGYR